MAAIAWRGVPAPPAFFQSWPYVRPPVRDASVAIDHLEEEISRKPLLCTYIHMPQMQISNFAYSHNSWHCALYLRSGKVHAYKLTKYIPSRQPAIIPAAVIAPFFRCWARTISTPSHHGGENDIMSTASVDLADRFQQLLLRIMSWMARWQQKMWNAAGSLG